MVLGRWPMLQPLLQLSAARIRNVLAHYYVADVALGDGASGGGALNKIRPEG